MSERDLPVMPFFVKDWIAATQHWTDAERGAYVSLILHQWVNGDVPPDVSQLARIMGTPEIDFDKRWAVVGRKFDGDAEGLQNKRVEEVRKKALEMHAAKLRAADAANAVRRAKKAHRVAAANAVRSENADAERSHTYTYTYKEEEQRKKEEGEHEREKPEEERTALAERASRETKNYWNDEKWIDFKLRYPHRSGGNDDVGAKKAWKARLREGHTWEELLAGAERYNAYCEAAGKIGTEYVMQRKTFCGPSKRFLDDWEVPADAKRDTPWSPPSDDPPEAA